MSVLVGPAGAGKGVVIDAAARAEQLVGRETLGLAVSGSTAERLGTDSPALVGSTLTLDALIDAAPDDTLGSVERVLYLAAALTGLRHGELLGLKWLDIDCHVCRVRVADNFTRGKMGTPKSHEGVRCRWPLVSVASWRRCASVPTSCKMTIWSSVIPRPGTCSIRRRCASASRKCSTRPGHGRSPSTSCATRSARRWRQPELRY